jgi:hypothetical protein
MQIKKWSFVLLTLLVLFSGCLSAKSGETAVNISNEKIQQKYFSIQMVMK